MAARPRRLLPRRSAVFFEKRYVIFTPPAGLTVCGFFICQFINKNNYKREKEISITTPPPGQVPLNSLSWDFLGKENGRTEKHKNSS